MLAWSLVLSLIAALVQFLAQRWKGEFSIEQLIGGYVSLAGRNRILELDVAATLENHYIANKDAPLRHQVVSGDPGPGRRRRRPCSH